MNSNKNDKQKGKSITDQICDIDNKILDLLSKRSDLLKKAAQARGQKKISIVDSEQEKRIWKKWYENSEKLDLNEKLLKKIFHFSNALGYQKAEEKSEEQFALSPTTKEANINITGPRDRDLTRFWLSIAALCSTAIKIEPAILNDTNIELAKAMNMADGNFAWEKSGIGKEAGGMLDFEQKLIFVGGDSINLYLLAVLAILEPGYCKFTGNSELKVQNLNHVYEFLPQLGARAVPLIPGNEGLPIRIESSGELAEEIFFAEDAPEEFVAVVCLCLPFMNNAGKTEEFRLQWPSPFTTYSRLERVASVLRYCGIKADLGDCEFRVKLKDKPTCPQVPEISLDPALSAYVLVMPRILGGVVQLQGEFPDWTTDGKLVKDILSALGVSLEIYPEKVVAARSETLDGRIQLDISTRSELYPLCLALGLVLPNSVAIRSAEEDMADFGIFLLDKLGASYQQEDDTLEIMDCPTSSPEKVNISVPDAWWGLAVALVSLKRPGIVLGNPGELTRLWPYFWHLYKGLPDPQVTGKKGDNTLSNSSQRSKRRRKVE